MASHRRQYDVISMSRACWVSSRDLEHCYLKVPSYTKEYCLNIQSTLVISKLKGLSETLRDIRTSTYQIFRIKENPMAQPNFTYEYAIRHLQLEIYTDNIVGKCISGEIAPKEQFLLLSIIICYLMLDFYV